MQSPMCSHSIALVSNGQRIRHRVLIESQRIGLGTRPFAVPTEQPLLAPRCFIQ